MPKIDLKPEEIIIHRAQSSWRTVRLLVKFALWLLVFTIILALAYSLLPVLRSNGTPVTVSLPNFFALPVLAIIAAGILAVWISFRKLFIDREVYTLTTDRIIVHYGPFGHKKSELSMVGAIAVIVTYNFVGDAELEIIFPVEFERRFVIGSVERPEVFADIIRWRITQADIEDTNYMLRQLYADQVLCKPTTTHNDIDEGQQTATKPKAEQVVSPNGP